MGMKVIRRLSAKFFQLIENGKLDEYDCDMITNGFQLNPKLLAELMDLKVSKLQITLDGPAHIHDTRRMLKGKGGATYDKILKNILEIPPQMSVVVRINVDKGNCDHVEELLRDLDEKGIFEKAVVNVAKVEDFLGHAELPSSFMSSVEYARFESELQSKAAEHGWPLHITSLSPSITGVCQVDSINSFVINHKGELMKCWAELGNKGHIVGNILDEASWRNIKTTVLTERDPFDDAECMSCELLPTCMGSCPLIRHNNRKHGVKICPPFKYNYPQLLEAQYTDKSLIIKYMVPEPV